jgi:hypothetical protein
MQVSLRSRWGWSSLLSWCHANRLHRRRDPHRRMTTTVRLGTEPLEARRVLDARMVISEIVADNEQGLEDEDGDRADWLEVYNAGDAPADLAGWHLTDDDDDLSKWSFPAVIVQPEQYLVVFASGKDRHDPAAPLHTNFQLSRDGEYLALTRADKTVASEYSRRFPPLQPDTSFGMPQDMLDSLWIGEQSAVRAFVPTAENDGEALGTSWTAVEFDDATWRSGSGGVGFDAGTGYEEHITTDVEAAMYGVNTSIFLRIPFTVDNPYAALSMRLGMKYDDGYVVYLNGAELDRRNAPESVNWNSAATTNHRDTQATQYEVTDVSSHLGLLQSGVNVLAIHGMNSDPSSDDFLIAAELQVETPGTIQTDVTRYFERATPGQPNGIVSYSGLTADVAVSVERGFYEQPFEVVLASGTPGATLVFTTDGSAPSLENGTVTMPAGPSASPTARMQITTTTTLRAAAFKDDFLMSHVNTQSYIMLSDVITQDFQATLEAGFPELWGRTEPDYGVDSDVVGPNDQYEGEFAGQIIDALKAAPTISVVMDMQDLFGPEGIYLNSTQSGADWERPTSFEFIEADGSASIQANAGVRIQGDNVRTFGNSKKQSLRFEFRERYGPTKLRYPIFGPNATDSFDTLILRGGYNDAWVHSPATSQYIRDQWARTTLLEMGQPQVHGRFVHVYLNGFYWGVYNLVERPNASFSASYLGGDKDDWDALNTGNVRDGTRDAWSQLLSVSRDVSDDDAAVSRAAYQRLLGRNPDGTDNPTLETLLDIDNYIDYLIVNFYGGNVDWPGRNYYVGRLRGSESTGFKFYAWDTEKILDHGEGSDLNTNRLNVTDGVAAPYRSLRDHEEFRLLFADRVHRHFFHGGALYVDAANPEWNPERPELNRPAARYDELAGDVELPFIGESARWGDTQSTATRNDGRTYTLHDWQAIRDRLFERYFPRRSEIVLNQFIQAGLYPQLAAPVFNQHGGSIQSGFELEIQASGQVYFTLDGSDPRRSSLEPGATESGVSAAAMPYTGSVALTESTLVKARTFADGQWSALNEAVFVMDVPTLRIAEVMYHPLDAELGSFDAEEFEFVELVNVSTAATVDLEGVAITAGVGFVFPPMSLAPGERVVVARNHDAFVQRYGDQVNLAGQYGNTPEDFKLNNAGESLRLVDRFGTLMQELAYSDAWFPSTDGEGFSLTAIDLLAPADQWSSATNWRASARVGGSPGSVDLADFNNDGRMDVLDIDALSAGLRANDPRFDLTGDGTVDHADLAFLIHDLLGTQFGDANLNGEFDSSDLVQVLQAGEYEDEVSGNSTWADGDWNGDGDFNSADIVLAFSSGTYVDPAPFAHQGTAWRREQLYDLVFALESSPWRDEWTPESNGSRARSVV